MSDGWELFKHPSSVFTEVTTAFFICFSCFLHREYTGNRSPQTSAAGASSWKVLLVLRCTAAVPGCCRAGIGIAAGFPAFQPGFHITLLPLSAPSLASSCFGRKQMEQCSSGEDASAGLVSACPGRGIPVLEQHWELPLTSTQHRWGLYQSWGNISLSPFETQVPIWSKMLGRTQGAKKCPRGVSYRSQIPAFWHSSLTHL